METFSHHMSPLHQLGIRNMLSIDTPIFSNLPLTNSALHLFIGIALVFVVAAVLLLIYKASLASSTNLIPKNDTLTNHNGKGKEMRGTVDILCSTVNKDIRFLDNASSTTTTVNKKTNFFYDNNDRTGASILGLPTSTTARNVTLNIGDREVTGILIRISPNYPSSPLVTPLGVRHNWWARTTAHSDVTTSGLPIRPDPNQNLAIHVTRDASSLVRDPRNIISYVVN